MKFMGKLKEKDSVYIVWGCTNEYDSYHSWTVCYFDDELAAHNYTDYLNNFLKELGFHRDKITNFWNYETGSLDTMPTKDKGYQKMKERFALWQQQFASAEAKLQTLDPNAHIQFPGTKYFVTTLNKDIALPGGHGEK